VYKYLSAILLTALLVAAGSLWWEKHSHAKERRKLHNALAKTEEMQKETDSAYSRRGLELEDLKVKSKKLQHIIDDRNESVLALAETNIRLRNKYFKIKKAKETLQDKRGNDIDVEKLPEDLKKLYDVVMDSGLRFKVDFEHTEEPLKVKGFTLTNPAYAEVKLEWTRDLQLQFILTKTDKDIYRVYIDSENSDIVPTDLKLTVDSSILELKWYEKIALGTDIGIGPAIQTGLSVFYDVRKNWFVGPKILWQYDGNEFKTFYSINLGWYPFR